MQPKTLTRASISGFLSMTSAFQFHQQFSQLPVAIIFRTGMYTGGQCLKTPGGEVAVVTGVVECLGYERKIRSRCQRHCVKLCPIISAGTDVICNVGQVCTSVRLHQSLSTGYTSWCDPNSTLPSTDADLRFHKWESSSRVMDPLSFERLCLNFIHVVTLSQSVYTQSLRVIRVSELCLCFPALPYLGLEIYATDKGHAHFYTIYLRS